MKKLFAVLAVLFIAGTTSVFAKTGIGAQGGYTVGGTGNAALSLKVESLPCVLAIDLGLGNQLRVGCTADWWMANPSIEGVWKYYYGVGIGAAIGVGGAMDLTVGPRAVIGTNLFLLDDFLELYLQAAWQPSFHMWFDSNNGKAGFWWGYFPVNAGFRFWF